MNNCLFCKKQLPKEIPPKKYCDTLCRITFSRKQSTDWIPHKDRLAMKFRERVHELRRKGKTYNQMHLFTGLTHEKIDYLLSY